MSKKTQNPPNVILKTDPLITFNTLIEKVRNDVIGGGDLPTKYAYLGWHGADTWYKITQQLDGYYKASVVLQIHFRAIHEKISQDAGTSAFDIVSLGIGTGDGDVKILELCNQIDSIREKPFRYYAVDLSSDLLKYGVHQLATRYAANMHSYKLNEIVGICCDIDLPYSYFSQRQWKGKSKKNIFHLLGLTFGNNVETRFLNNILQIMNVGDYLIFDVDFSADDQKNIDKKLEVFKSNKGLTNRFLMNALLFSVDLNNGVFRLNHNGSVIESIAIEYKSDAIDVGKSVIPGALSLERYHKYTKSNTAITQPRRCDYSNIYKKGLFKDWLKNQEHVLGFYVINNISDDNPFFESDASGHPIALVVIKKCDRQTLTTPPAHHSSDDDAAILRDKILTHIEAKRGESPPKGICSQLSQIETLVQGSSDITKLRATVQTIESRHFAPNVLDEIIKIYCIES